MEIQGDRFIKLCSKVSISMRNRLINEFSLFVMENMADVVYMSKICKLVQWLLSRPIE